MDTQVKLLLASVSLSLMLMTPARADVFNVTPLDMYPPAVPGVQGTFLTRTINGGSAAFDDLWTFDVSGDGAHGGISLSAFSTTFAGGTPSQGPLALQLFLLAWDGSGYSTLLDASSVELAPSVQAALPAHQTGAPGHGFYALEVIGTTPADAVMTQYSGQLQVAAVPEPSMFIFASTGLLLIGWQVRRSARQS